MDNNVYKENSTENNLDSRIDFEPVRITVEDDVDNTPMTFAEEEKKQPAELDKENISSEIMEYIYAQVIQETFNKIIPIRKPMIATSGTQPAESIKPRSISLLTLATMKHEGIRTDQYFINRYIDDLFIELRNYCGNYIDEINKSIDKSPLETLKNLQTAEESRITEELPHEINPIAPLSAYFNIEKKYELKDPEMQVFAKFMHTHNKAIFDSVNEALNLIRPYGLNGEPMPWSNQGRILFKDITDKNIIIRNIKNMVLDWVSFEVGTLPSPEFLLNGKFDEDYFIEIREKQLATLLAQEVICYNI